MSRSKMRCISNHRLIMLKPDNNLFTFNYFKVLLIILLQTGQIPNIYSVGYRYR